MCPNIIMHMHLNSGEQDALKNNDVLVHVHNLIFPIAAKCLKSCRRFVLYLIEYALLER